ncbi:MAG: hypothetical protein DYH02_10005 [Candidatus Omnitrophica bacterium COP1]|nr:hypothetical protein [Candidatus Omnitrophica bacterium COP1]
MIRTCRSLFLAVLFGWVSLNGGWIQAQEPPAPGSDRLVQMNSVFGRPRQATKDSIYFINGDVLGGEVTNEILHLTAPYGEIMLPLRKCAGISFENSERAGETVITLNANRLSGIFSDRTINFRIESANAEVPIRKDRIRMIILRKSPLEVGLLNSSVDMDLFVMKNGDLMTGKFLEQGIKIRQDLNEVTVPLPESESIDFSRSEDGIATIRRRNGETTSGVLQTEELTLVLDIGIRLDSVFKDRLIRFSAGDGIRKAFAELDRTSPHLAELPSEDDTPPRPTAPPPTPTSLPTPTEMPLPTQTPSPSATALPEPIVFESEKYGFRIERPNESWRITTEPEELRSLNEDAVVAFESPEGVFSMVILEHLPQVSLDEYVSAVSPDLENVELLSDEKGTLTGFPARKRVFRGTHNDLPFRFFYTLVAKGEDRMQIVSWCAESTLTEQLVKQINVLENSFGPYQPPSPAPRKSPTRLPVRGGNSGDVPPR